MGVFTATGDDASDDMLMQELDDLLERPMSPVPLLELPSVPLPTPRPMLEPLPLPEPLPEPKLEPLPEPKPEPRRQLITEIASSHFA
jgi:hypothetical protein